MRSMSLTKKGFTLVEMVVVMPMVILLIGTLVAAIIFTTTRGLQSQGRAQLQLDVLTAIDRIEQDVKLSVDRDISDDQVVHLTNLATTRNPLSPDRQLISADSCTVASGVTDVDEALQYQIRYHATESSYVRTTELSDCTSSSAVWQTDLEEVLISNAEVDITIEYLSRDAMRIELTASRDVAGQTLSYTGRLFVRSINI